MTALVDAHGVGISFGTSTVLDDVTLTLELGDQPTERAHRAPVDVTPDAGDTL